MTWKHWEFECTAWAGVAKCQEPYDKPINTNTSCIEGWGVVGEEAFVPNKLIIWTTDSDLRELLIGNPSSFASSPVSFHMLPSLISPYSSFLNAGLWIAHLLVPFLLPGVPLQLCLPDILILFVFSWWNFAMPQGWLPSTAFIWMVYRGKKELLYCKSLPRSSLQEHFLCCLLLIVMLCLDLSTNPEDALCLPGYSPQWSHRLKAVLCG